MDKVILNILSIVCAICIVIALAFTAMQVVIFDESRFIESYEDNNLYEFIGIDKEDLHEITREMLDYLKGDRADLVMHAEIRGEYQQVFEEREILHMVDVQYLFLGGMKIRNISAIVGIILLVVLFAVWRKRAIKPLCKSYLWVMAAILALAIILGIAMLIDFTGLFIKFHHMFFSNDLWLLDLDNDVLIQMLPEQFFNDMAMAIVYYMGAFILVPAIASIVYLVLDRKRNGK